MALKKRNFTLRNIPQKSIQMMTRMIYYDNNDDPYHMMYYSIGAILNIAMSCLPINSCYSSDSMQKEQKEIPGEATLVVGGCYVMGRTYFQRCCWRKITPLLFLLNSFKSLCTKMYEHIKMCHGINLQDLIKTGPDQVKFLSF